MPSLGSDPLDRILIPISDPSRPNLMTRADAIWSGPPISRSSPPPLLPVEPPPDPEEPTAPDG